MMHGVVTSRRFLYLQGSITNEFENYYFQWQHEYANQNITNVDAGACALWCRKALIGPWPIAAAARIIHSRRFLCANLSDHRSGNRHRRGNRGMDGGRQLCPLLANVRDHGGDSHRSARWV